MNRAALKQEAKNAMNSAQPNPVLVTLAMFGILIGAGFVSGIVMGILSFLGYFGAFLGSLVSLAVVLCAYTVVFGYYSYSLKVFKREAVGIPELWSYIGQLLKIIGLFLWMALFIMLWSMLLYIPGIIAAIRYSQAIFIMIENPEKGIRECVNESKMMMQGRWGEYFVLCLSFIPWVLLTSVTLIIAGLYVIPYMCTTMAGYYEMIKNAPRG